MADGAWGRSFSVRQTGIHAEARRPQSSVFSASSAPLREIRTGHGCAQGFRVELFSGRARLLPSRLVFVRSFRRAARQEPRPPKLTIIPEHTLS